MSDIVVELRNAGGRHVIDDDVGFGGEAFEQFGETVELSNFAAVIRADGGPKEEIAAFIAEALQRFANTIEEFAVGIDDGEIDVDEDVGIFHRG